ncbi:MAG: ABC transporter permease [Methanophagales archaeon]|nr:ABC transporter permease [Methanophagales archaeon]
MDPIEPFITAFESIGSSKARSFLTTLGILIAVAAVIANVSIGTGFQVYWEEAVMGMGSNLIMIIPQEEGALNDRELDAVRGTPGVVEASPYGNSNTRVRFMSETKRLMVSGVTKEYQQVCNPELEEGDFLSDQDTYAAVLGYDVAHNRDIFSRNISVRSPIEITVTRSNGEECTETFLVKGIITDSSALPMGMQYSFHPDEQIFIPESTLSEMLDKSGYAIFASAESIDEVDEVTEDIEDRLDRLLGVMKISRMEPPYTIMKQKEILEMIQKSTGFLNSILLAIAFISLLVGSIGIMNIMLVTVTERTREIGLMKAVGATRFDVLMTFLVESGMLGLIGGAFGVALGVGFCKIIPVINLPLPPPVTPIEWVFIGLGVALAVGIVSGFYPAYKAARMRPLEALRYE